MVTSAKPRDVRIPAGRSAVFVFNKNVCEMTPAADVVLAHTLRVALPGNSRTRSIRLPNYLFLDSCVHGDIGRIISISPIVLRLADASAGP